ncbi:MAG: PAS domain-containing protein [Chloroflexi bacterium]|nr:PAS domain-containing protein [Chloroflexota bacterium]
MDKLFGKSNPTNTLGLAQIRRQLLQRVLVGFTAVLVIGILFWSIFGGQLNNLPIMEGRFWYLGAAMLIGFSASYLLCHKWRYEAGAVLLLLIIVCGLFLVDYPDKITRGRGLLLSAIPIVLSAAIMPSIATVIVGAVITFMTVGLSVIVLHQAPDYLGIVGLVIVTTVSWVGALGLEASVRALGNNLQARQGAQEALRRRLAMEHLLSQLSTRLIALQPDQVPDEIRWALQIIGQHMAADRCYISLLSAEGVITSHVYEWHSSNVPPLTDPTLSRSLDSLVWARVRFTGSEGLAIDDVSKLEGASEIERAAWSGLGVASILVMPMVLQQTLLGFIACNSEKEQRSWTDDEIKLLQLAAGTLANVLARGRAETELQQSEERLKLALTGAELGMYDLNLDTDVMYVDERYLAVLGYKPNELHLTVDTFMGLVHPDDKERLEKLYIKQRKTKDRVAEIEYRMLAKNGEYHWIQDRGQTIRRSTDNEPSRISGTCLDITLRKQMEEEIQAAETRYRNLVEHLPAIVYIIKDINIVYVSPQVSSILGYTQEEYLASPTHWLDFIHPDDVDSVKKSLANRKTRQSVNLEYRVYHKDGSLVWVHDESDQVLDKDGKNSYVQGIIQNITDRVLAEEAIRESQTNLMLAQQIAGVGGWSLEVSTGQVFISDDLFRTLNTTDKTDLPIYPDTLQLYIHPDHWPVLHAAIDSALAGGPDVDLRVRMYMPGDIPFFVHMKSISIKDTAGKVVRLVGMIQDISSSMQAEEIYQACRTDLELIQKFERIGTWNIDVNSGHITLSEFSLNLLEASAQGVGPKPVAWFADQLYSNDRERFEQSLLRTTTTGEQLDLELHLQAQGATSHCYRMAGFAQYDGSSHVSHIVGILHEMPEG